MRIKWLEETISEKRQELDAIFELVEKEERARKEDEVKRSNELAGEIESLEDELKTLRKKQGQKENEEKRKQEEKDAAMAAGGPVGEAEEREKEVVKKRYSFYEAYRTLKERKSFDGLQREMHEEANKEVRDIAFEGVGVPSWMVSAKEQRADISQTSSAIQGTDVGAYVQALRENAVYSQVIPSTNIFEGLSSDLNIQDVNKITTAWATSENATAADGGANLSKETLSPLRLTSTANISKRLPIQNGQQVMNAIMTSVGEDAAVKIDTALFAASTATGAIPAIAAASGVLTFTEAATYAAPSSTVRGTIYDDLVKGIQTLADSDAAQGALAIVASSKFYTDLVQSPQVINVSGAVQGVQPGAPMVFNINGVPVFLSTSTATATGTADFVGGDFRRQFVGFFGGLDMMIDPYTNGADAQDRLLFHRWLDAATIQGEAFVKATVVLS